MENVELEVGTNRYVAGREKGTDCFVCQVGTVIVATEVTEPYVTESRVVVLDECLCALVIGEVSATVADAFLKNEWIVPGAEQVGVVVGFEHYMSGTLKGLGHFGGYFTYIGHEGKD